jgi:low density lipoprotein-related protein 2
LLFAAKYSVRGIPINESDTGDAMLQMFAANSGRRGVNYVALDYMAEDQTVYFSDIRNYAIMKAKVDGSEGIITKDLGLGVWCLMHLSIIFQLLRGDQCY